MVAMRLSGDRGPEKEACLVRSKNPRRPGRWHAEGKIEGEEVGVADPARVGLWLIL